MRHVPPSRDSWRPNLTASHHKGNPPSQSAGNRITHSHGEYVRGKVHTNTVEGYFSIFKRGMRGIYQHCSEKHLHRYLAEFDSRYNNRIALGIDDATRAELLAAGIKGTRLTYRRPYSHHAAPF